MKILFDTCIVLDFFQNREPFAEDAEKLLQLSSIDYIDAYVTSNSISDFYYLMHSYYHNNEMCLTNIKKLLSILHVADLLSCDVINACLSGMSDYEDSLLSEVAYRLGADYIVTRNINDFKKSKTKAILPKDLLGIINKKSSN